MNPDILQRIETRDAQRVRATIAADLDALADVFGESLRYTHSSASVDTREQYIENLRAGVYKYQTITNVTREFRMIGDVVLVNGDVRIDVVARGTLKHLNNRYLAVWAQENGDWRMVSWQSTPIPA